MAARDGSWFRPRQSRAQNGIILDQSSLNVERQINYHRPRPTILGNTERFTQHPGQLRWFLDHHTPFGDGGGAANHIDTLEGFFMKYMGGGLTSDADQRDGNQRLPYRGR